MTESEISIGLRILGTPLVLSGPSDLEEPWRQLWRPFLVPSVPAGSPRVEVSREQWGYAIRSAGRDVNVTDVWRALVESRNDLVRMAIEGTQGLIDVHAAVLVREGRALILLGEAWSGKTTIALKLVKRGWRYFSDDLAVFDPSGEVRPLPKPPGVKAHPWDQMKHHWHPVPEALGAPPGPFVIPPPFEGSMEDRATPRWMVFLDYRGQGEVETEELSAAGALARAGKHLRKLNPQSLNTLRSVCLLSQGAAMAYHRPDQAVQKLQEMTIDLDAL